MLLTCLFSLIFNFLSLQSLQHICGNRLHHSSFYLSHIGSLSSEWQFAAVKFQPCSRSPCLHSSSTLQYKTSVRLFKSLDQLATKSINVKPLSISNKYFLEICSLHLCLNSQSLHNWRTSCSAASALCRSVHVLKYASSSLHRCSTSWKQVHLHSLLAQNLSCQYMESASRDLH